MKTAAFLIVSLLLTAISAFAGPLTPPVGPVTPTPGPEPRIAINSTNTPGNASSTFRITQPGSYYLPGNILGEASKRGIEIASDNITIDLMGFELRGVAGSLDGIASLASRTNIAVRNGIVSNWGSGGVELAFSDCRNSIIENIHASSNGTIGIRCGSYGIIRNCVSRSNGSFGIIGFDGSLVENCSAVFNTNSGIFCGSGTIIRSCTARVNQNGGIQVSSNGRILDCTAISNTATGFLLGSGSIITGSTAVSNSTDGIQVGNDCIVLNNLCNLNGSGGLGAGIRATGSDNRIEGNNCNGADVGIDVDFAGNIIIRNTCSDNTTNWTIVANNVVGPIIDRTAPASAGINGNTAPDSTGSTHPNANFTY